MATRTQTYKEGCSARDRRIAELEAQYEALRAHSEQKLAASMKETEDAKVATLERAKDYAYEKEKVAKLTAELVAANKALEEAKARMFDAEQKLASIVKATIAVSEASKVAE